MDRFHRPVINRQHVGESVRYTPDWYTNDPRTAAITTWLDDRQVHPDTILDFGALTCRQATLLAEHYGATVTAVDDSPELLDTFTTPKTGTVNIVTRRIGPTEIKRGGPYDVAICLSVLHHLAHWRSYLTALTASARIVFVEAPHPDEVLPGVDGHKNTPAIHAELAKRGAEYVCTAPGWDSRYMRDTYVIAWP